MGVVVGLGGRKENGKDAVADYLVSEHGFVKIGMSDPLHKAMLTLNPYVVVQWDDDRDHVTPVRYATITESLGYTEAKQNDEYRRLLQVFGTEVVRDLFGVNLWVDKARERIQELLDKGRNVALTGVRFENELALIHEFQGETWWVERPGYGLTNMSNHASEQTLDGDAFDVVLFNNRRLDDLYDKVYYELVKGIDK